LVRNMWDNSWDDPFAEDWTHKDVGYASNSTEIKFNTLVEAPETYVAVKLFGGETYRFNSLIDEVNEYLEGRDVIDVEFKDAESGVLFKVFTREVKPQTEEEAAEQKRARSPYDYDYGFVLAEKRGRR